MNFSDDGDLRPRAYDLIVFDWDGTLFDSTALIARSIQLACEDMGLPVPARHEAAYVIGLGLHDALAHVAPTLPADQVPAMGQRYRHHYFRQQGELSLFDGTVELLQALKARHHWLAVATGKSRQGLNEALTHVELRGMFDGTRTADETASKPHPLMLQELMAEFGVDPERTLMIGDTTHDLQLALNAGTHSVAVSYGAHEPAAFADYPTRFVAHSTADLHDWLLRHA
ncbi:MAG: HAD family hydrolase [Burkholderiales bacterium RIFCSPLOWO2_12_FULL_64_99]|nr:MAG: HAD family hydrolase [Burkholderiales bacterium RIFCSPHIGHO2_12_FULL_63_20]OGB67785.1 MAG: HAD family hydrolase [Burkholderiales bacterium RIFCSPLOWO2_12_FULL_64_99]